MAHVHFTCPNSKCRKHFQSQDELSEHTQIYEDRLRKALDNVRDLIAHRDCFGSEPDTDQGNPNSSEAYTETRHSPTRWRCPDSTCGQKFTRYQDLRRHYGLHCDCNEKCLSCGKTYEKSSRFVSHICFRSKRIEPESKRQRDKVRSNIVRDLRNLTNNTQTNRSRKDKSRNQKVSRQEEAQARNIIEEHDNQELAFVGNDPRDRMQCPIESWGPKTSSHPWDNNYQDSLYTEPDFARLFNSGQIDMLSLNHPDAWDRFAVGIVHNPPSFGVGGPVD